MKTTYKSTNPTAETFCARFRDQKNTDRNVIQTPDFFTNLYVRNIVF